MNTHETDVVIATRNRPDTLRRCLEGLSEQTYRDFGVIVVDDASDVPVLDQLGDAFDTKLSLTFLRLEENGGPARARNAGTSASRARYIVFIDDDVRPDPRLLEVHVDAISSEDKVVSLGPFVAPPDWKPTPWNLWEAQQARFETECLMRGDYAPTWRQFHTGNNALSRELFESAGGFDESFLRAEDDEFALRLARLGVKFVFNPDAIALHYSNRSLESWLAIPKAYAHFDAEIDAMYPDEGYLQRKREELAHRHPILRAFRTVFMTGRLEHVGIVAATSAARVLNSVRCSRLAMDSLSVAYDLAYCSSMAHESRIRRIAGHPDRPPAASTSQ